MYAGPGRGTQNKGPHPGPDRRTATHHVVRPPSRLGGPLPPSHTPTDPASPDVVSAPAPTRLGGGDAELTNRWLRRGTHRSTNEVVVSIRIWIDMWNDDPKAYV